MSSHLKQNLSTETLEDVISRVQMEFFNNAKFYDRTATFPQANFDLIYNNKLHTLPLDKLYGGLELGFEKISDILVSLASGCSSTSLCLAMHYYTLAGLNHVFTKKQKEEIFGNCWRNGEFFASFNQPNIFVVHAKQNFNNTTGISIEKVQGGYVVNGKKNFVSGITRFKYLPVFGNQNGVKNSSFGITALLLRKDDPGVTIEESWDYSGMRSTLSHNVILHNVFVSEERLIGREGFGIEDTPTLSIWSHLAISSVYLGIAKAAIDYIKKITKEKKDMISQKLIAYLPGVQFNFAEIIIKYEVASSQLKMFAKQADTEQMSGSFTDELYQKALISKYFIGRIANEIVWQAMQIQGMSSMFNGSLLERLYRDVRSATFHQPNNDLSKEILAKKTLGLIAPKSRWA